MADFRFTRTVAAEIQPARKGHRRRWNEALLGAARGIERAAGRVTLVVTTADHYNALLKNQRAGEYHGGRCAPDGTRYGGDDNCA